MRSDPAALSHGVAALLNTKDWLNLVLYADAGFTTKSGKRNKEHEAIYNYRRLHVPCLETVGKIIQRQFAMTIAHSPRPRATTSLPCKVGKSAHLLLQ